MRTENWRVRLRPEYSVIRDGVADLPNDKNLLFECLDDSKTRKL